MQSPATIAAVPGAGSAEPMRGIVSAGGSVPRALLQRSDGPGESCDSPESGGIVSLVSVVGTERD